MSNILYVLQTKADKGSESIHSLTFDEQHCTSEIMNLPLSDKRDAKIVELSTDNFLSPDPKALKIQDYISWGTCKILTHHLLF